MATVMARIPEEKGGFKPGSPVAMVIVGLDHQETVQGILEYNELRGWDAADFVFVNGHARLDPGGAYFGAIPEEQFSLDGEEFYIQGHNIEIILEGLMGAIVPLPGLRLAGVCNTGSIVRNLIVAQSIYEKLIDHLGILLLRNETVAATIEKFKILEKLKNRRIS